MIAARRISVTLAPHAARMDPMSPDPVRTVGDVPNESPQLGSAGIISALSRTRKVRSHA